MSIKKKKREDLKSVKPVQPARLTFRVIRNARTQGRAPSEDRFTLSKGGYLLFNSITRKKFNILSGYVRFLAANEPGEERNVFLSVHKTKDGPEYMPIQKMNENYYKVRVPSYAAKEVGMVFKAVGGRGKRKRSITQYRAEQYKPSPKNRKVKLIPVEIAEA